MNIINCSAAILITIVFTSCSSPRYIYSPSATNVAMASGAGDGNLTAYVSVSGNGAGVNAAGNYALGKFFGIGAQYYYTGDKNQGTINNIGSPGSEHTELKYTRRLAAAQVFFFTPFDKEKRVFGELAVGYGSGRYHFDDVQTHTSGAITTRNTYSHTSPVKHTMAHASFYGLMGQQKNVRLGMALRFNSLRFHDISTTYSNVQQRDYYLDSLTYSAINFLEPSLNCRVGFKEIPGFEVALQIGVTTKLNGPVFYHRGAQSSIGITYSFGKKKKQ